jgi:hypothetical protein
MHKNVTHNRCYTTCGQFADATLDFLRYKVPKNWRRFRESVTDNFRVINQRIFGLWREQGIPARSIDYPAAMPVAGR